MNLKVIREDASDHFFLIILHLRIQTLWEAAPLAFMPHQQ